MTLAAGGGCDCQADPSAPSLNSQPLAPSVASTRPDAAAKPTVPERAEAGPDAVSTDASAKAPKFISLDRAQLSLAFEAQQWVRRWARAQYERDLPKYLAEHHADATITVEQRPGRPGPPRLITDVAAARLERLAYKSRAGLGAQPMSPLESASGLEVRTEQCTGSASRLVRCRRLTLDLEPDAKSELRLRRQVSHPEYAIESSHEHVPRLTLTSPVLQVTLVRGPCKAEQRFKNRLEGDCERHGAMLVLSTDSAQYHLDLMAPSMSDTTRPEREFSRPHALALVWHANTHNESADYLIERKANKLTIELEVRDPEMFSSEQRPVEKVAEIEFPTSSSVPFFCMSYEDKAPRPCLPSVHAL